MTPFEFLQDLYTSKKTIYRVLEVPCHENPIILGSAVSIQYWRVTDGQTLHNSIPYVLCYVRTQAVYLPCDLHLLSASLHNDRQMLTTERLIHSWLYNRNITKIYCSDTNQLLCFCNSTQEINASCIVVQHLRRWTTTKIS